MHRKSASAPPVGDGSRAAAARSYMAPELVRTAPHGAVEREFMSSIAIEAGGLSLLTCQRICHFSQRTNACPGFPCDPLRQHFTGLQSSCFDCDKPGPTLAESSSLTSAKSSEKSKKGTQRRFRYGQKTAYRQPGPQEWVAHRRRDHHTALRTRLLSPNFAAAQLSTPICMSIKASATARNWLSSQPLHQPLLLRTTIKSNSILSKRPAESIRRIISGS
jgi:hypothetical protein